MTLYSRLLIGAPMAARTGFCAGPARRGCAVLCFAFHPVSPQPISAGSAGRLDENVRRTKDSSHQSCIISNIAL